MAITRTTLTLRSRQMADAVDSTTDWAPALVSAIATFVFIDEWKKLLGAAPHLRTNRVSGLVPDSDGRLAWSALTTGTGDTAKIGYRLLQLRGASGVEFVYTQASRIDLLQDLTSFHTDRVWTRVGDDLQIVGTETGLTALVNWIPTAPDDLAGDTSTVDWPSGYEMLLYLETAALMLAKGGRETNEARDLQVQAEIVRQKMHQDFARDTNAPYVIGASDGAWEWGG